MFTKLKDWWKDRKRQRDRKHFEIGFCWAAGQILLEQETPESIWSSIATADTFGHTTAFDKGAAVALKVLVDKGVIKYSE